MKTAAMMIALAVGMVGCSGCAGPATQNPAKEHAVAKDEPARIELVQDKPVGLGHGVTATLKTGIYSHLAESKNESMIVLELSSGGKTESVTLQRLTPGPFTYTKAFGLQLAVDYVDPYHQPTTAAVLVLPE
jgi:hypothetical protein